METFQLQLLYKNNVLLVEHSFSKSLVKNRKMKWKENELMAIN